LTLYNRWGEVIFVSHNVNEGWDGTYNNMSVPIGLYVWIIEMKSLNTDNRQIFKGSVNVLK